MVSLSEVFCLTTVTNDSTSVLRGIYLSLDEAVEDLKKNGGWLEECYYSHVVIENSALGRIDNVGVDIQEYWFEADVEEDVPGKRQISYLPCPKPAKFAGIVHWGVP